MGAIILHALSYLCLHFVTQLQSHCQDTVYIIFKIGDLLIPNYDFK